MHVFVYTVCICMCPYKHTTQLSNNVLYIQGVQGVDGGVQYCLFPCVLYVQATLYIPYWQLCP